MLSKIMLFAQPGCLTDSDRGFYELTSVDPYGSDFRACISAALHYPFVLPSEQAMLALKERCKVGQAQDSYAYEVLCCYVCFTSPIGIDVAMDMEKVIQAALQGCINSNQLAPLIKAYANRGGVHQGAAHPWPHLLFICPSMFEKALIESNNVEI